MRNPAFGRGARGSMPWIFSFDDEGPDFTPEALPIQELRKLWRCLRTSGIPLTAERGVIVLDAETSTGPGGRISRAGARRVNTAFTFA